jgi:uncharacterized protein HemX
MIEFNTSQLTWIVVGACGLGGSGYLTLSDHMQNIDKKVEVTATIITETDKNISSLREQLIRIEDKIDRKQ